MWGNPLREKGGPFRNSILSPPLRVCSVTVLQAALTTTGGFTMYHQSQGQEEVGIMRLDNSFIYLLHIGACEGFVLSTGNRLNKAEKVCNYMEITNGKKETEVNNLTATLFHVMICPVVNTPWM